MDFNEIEATEGLRLAWNAWPSSRIEATRLVVPFGVMCTPLTELEGLQRLPYDPLLCKGCRAVLNPYCRVDYQAKIWVCPFCYQRNHFPQSYYEISDHNMPAELFPQCSSVEYVLSQPVAGVSNPGGNSYGQQGQGQPGGGGGPGFLFVLDTCMEAEDLQALKTAVIQILGIMPETALVGLISFGTMVHVHELGYTDCSKAYVFRGDRDIPSQQVCEFHPVPPSNVYGVLIILELSNDTELDNYRPDNSRAKYPLHGHLSNLVAFRRHAVRVSVGLLFLFFIVFF